MGRVKLEIARFYLLVKTFCAKKGLCASGIVIMEEFVTIMQKSGRLCLTN